MDKILLVICNGLSCFIICTILFQFMNERYKKSYSNRTLYIAAEIAMGITAFYINMLNFAILNLVCWSWCNGIFSVLRRCRQTNPQNYWEWSTGFMYVCMWNAGSASVTLFFADWWNFKYWCCHAILSGSGIFKDSADFPILCFDKQIDKKDRGSLFQRTIYHIWNHVFLQSGQYACDCAEF